jgi:hypothetical protein
MKLTIIICSHIYLKYISFRDIVDQSWKDLTFEKAKRNYILEQMEYQIANDI